MGRKYFLPPGSRDLTGKDAQKLWEVESKLTSLFFSLGLKKVYPPLLEYLTVFSRGIGADKQRKTYKFVDPSTGSLLVLRSDITPQIVRLWWSLNYPENFRVFYIERLVRIEGEYTGVEREIFQGGVELLNSSDVEKEIVKILFEVLEKFSVKDCRLVLGSTKLIDLLLRKYPYATECFVRRDISCMESSGVSSDLIELAVSPLQRDYVKVPQEFEDPLNEIFELTESDYDGVEVVVDPFLFPPSSYYNGIIFKVIGGGEEVIVGGRYDGLLERYGMKAPAAGFAINLLNFVSFALKGE